MIEEKKYDLLTHFFREDGFVGWVAHVLPLDVVTHGATLAEAIAMAEEAASEIILEDLNSGMEPLERVAPPEIWQAAFASVGAGSRKPVPLNRVIENEGNFRTVVASVVVTVARISDGVPSQPHHRVEGHSDEVRSFLTQTAG